MDPRQEEQARQYLRRMGALSTRREQLLRELTTGGDKRQQQDARILIAQEAKERGVQRCRASYVEQQARKFAISIFIWLGTAWFLVIFITELVSPSPWPQIGIGLLTSLTFMTGLFTVIHSRSQRKYRQCCALIEREFLESVYLAIAPASEKVRIMNERVASILRESGIVDDSNHGSQEEKS